MKTLFTKGDLSLSQAEGTMEEESNTAMEGSSILLDINHGDRLTFARLNTSATIKIGNLTFSLSPLIGSPYGAVFELQNGPKNGPSLVRILPRSREEGSSKDMIQGEERTEAADDGIGRDNRDLVDDNTAQKLSADDINQLRREGASGNRIVEELIANSTTFQKKTSFSQEKYKKKKQKKYAPQLVLRRPCTQSVCEEYFLKSPHKIGFLRMDMLALILYMADVGAHAEVMIMDMVGGLIIAAVAERLGGSGSICNIYHTVKPPPSDILGLFNINAATSKRIFKASLSELLAAHRVEVEKIVQDGAAAVTERDINYTGHSDTPLERVSCNNLIHTAAETAVEDEYQNSGGFKDAHCEGLDDMHIDGVTKESMEKEFFIEAKDETNNNLDSTGKQEANENDAKSKSRKLGTNAPAEEISQWLKHGFTSLIVAAPGLDPLSVLLQLLPFLSPSSPFVVYHRYLQPLADCMHQLQIKRLAISLQISEPWMREYQVLPSRTHPHMQMSSTGGYALSGIKVIAE